MLKQSRAREKRLEGESATMRKVTLYHNPG